MKFEKKRQLTQAESYIPLRFDDPVVGQTIAFTIPYSGVLRSIKIKQDGDGSGIVELSMNNTASPVTFMSKETEITDLNIGLQALDILNVKILAVIDSSGILLILNVLKT